MPGWLARAAALLVAAITCLAVSLPAAAAKRIALVIGNDAYQALSPLQKAVNDARAVEGALTELGFTVIEGENLTRRDMNRRLAELERSIEPGDTVFFFYAGHGVAIGAENYLLPIDMPLPQGGEESLVRNEGHAADAIIRAIQSKGAATTFVVLDACRNNPIADRGARNVGLDRGLARMDAPSGVFVLFSAGIGQTALDRLSEGESEPNSVFTRKLVPLLKKPGLSHVGLAKELQREVSQLAATIKHRQEPAYYDQIIGEVVLKEGTAPPSYAVEGEAKRVWEAIQSTDDISIIEGYRKQFGLSNPYYDSLALKRIETLREANVSADRRRVTMLEVEEDRKREEAEASRKAEEERKEIARLSEERREIEKIKEQLRRKGLLKETGSSNEFRDCDDKDPSSTYICPAMVVVPAGSFSMGSPETEEGRDNDEGPQRKVTIAKPFAVGKFEVTFAEWDACVAAGGCKHRPGDSGWGRGTHPVINVSWDDAKQYAVWLSKKTGRSYRLLTEAEWEYAARAGTTTPFSFGETITTDQANFDGNYTYGDSTTGKNRDKTVEVGSFKPNAFGLHDMHGNVWEWVEDCWQDSYRNEPVDGTASRAGDCRRRGVRGGCWGGHPKSLRSAGRYGYSAESRYFIVGFRIARPY